MKIGRYDRSPMMLQNDSRTSVGGRMYWSPSMIENIRSTREKAVEMFKAGGGAGSVTRLWRQEWELLYPDTNIDWKQVVSRYHYHFGERRDSSDTGQDNIMVTGARSARNSVEGRAVESDNEETETREYIGGFRQWTSSMQEDLLIMRNILLAADPNIDTSSKTFSKQLLSQFKHKHPNCMESERSLLSKLRESSNSTPAPVRTPSKPKFIKPVSKAVVTPKKNPAVDIMSDIEGFDDWNLGKVRDFISCMDRARRKYTDMKEADPQMKLVPLLLAEWKNIYPDTVETVRTFLVRIRYLKTNKESIKAKLGEHDLLPRMSVEESATNSIADTADDVGEDKDDEEPSPKSSIYEKFVWDSASMMPVVISTRAKAIAKQQREAAQGRRISYAKLWIKEFLKIYPNCPYTANNLSVHYWYWSKDKDKKSGDAPAPEKVRKSAHHVAHIDDEDSEIIEGPDWMDDHLEELRRLGEKVNKMLTESVKGEKDRKLQFSRLLHSVWLSLHPGSSETEDSLMIVYNRSLTVTDTKLPVKLTPTPRPSQEVVEVKWTPAHNKLLRQIVKTLRDKGEYIRVNVVKEWSKRFEKMDWEVLSSRIDDCGLPQPAHYVRVKEKKVESPKKVAATESSSVKPGQESEHTGSGLNARGQMRWTQTAVTDLLECHKLGLKAKNSHPTKKLADLVHQKFKQRHPYCPIAPNVLLTKCYILR